MSLAPHHVGSCRCCSEWAKMPKQFDTSAALLGGSTVAQAITDELVRRADSGVLYHARRALYLAAADLAKTFDLPPPCRRASGEVLCDRCSTTFGRHPLDPRWLDQDGTPYLHALCDGRLVKL